MIERQQYDYVLTPIPGKHDQGADLLSRAGARGCSTDEATEEFQQRNYYGLRTGDIIPVHPLHNTPIAWPEPLSIDCLLYTSPSPRDA